MMNDDTIESHSAAPLMFCNCRVCVDARIKDEIDQRIRDTRENPDGQVPRTVQEQTDDTTAWLKLLCRAEALGRASGIAAERERCAKIALDSVNAEGYRTTYDNPATWLYFKGAVDIACQIAANIESSE